VGSSDAESIDYNADGRIVAVFAIEIADLSTRSLLHASHSFGKLCLLGNADRAKPIIVMEELSVPLFITLLLLPLGIALFGLGWALRSYRCRYELDNARAAAGSAGSVSGLSGGSASSSAAGAKSASQSGSSSSASGSTSTKASSSTAKKATSAAKKTATSAAKSGSADTEVEYTATQQRVLDRTSKEAEKYVSGKVEPDDLTKLKGVAKVLNGRLNGFGVYSYEQIAKWKQLDIDAFGELLAFKERIINDDWIGQAKALHKEKYGKTI